MTEAKCKNCKTCKNNVMAAEEGGFGPPKNIIPHYCREICFVIDYDNPPYWMPTCPHYVAKQQEQNNDSNKSPQSND